MSHAPAPAVTKTYNAVITADITARFQGILLTTTGHLERVGKTCHTVVFTLCASRTPGLLKRVATELVTVDARGRDDDRAIVRRAAKQLGHPAHTAWWEYDATPATAELSDVLLGVEPDLPPTLQESTFAGLATIDDDNNTFAPLYSGVDHVG